MQGESKKIRGRDQARFFVVHNADYTVVHFGEVANDSFVETKQPDLTMYSKQNKGKYKQRLNKLKQEGRINEID
jgi:deoxycytidine triphosphate deaminase